jgi:hypothetical protein
LHNAPKAAPAAGGGGPVARGDRGVGGAAAAGCGSKEGSRG